MHRLTTGPLGGSLTPARETPRVESGRYTSGSDQPWSLFVPLHYEANYAYPLLVWLHGPGGDEQQLKRIMPHISLRNYAAVAIRGTERHLRPDGQPGGYGWCDSLGGAEALAVRIDEALSASRAQLHLADHRVFLAGFDAGGTMALRVALQHPRRFAGVLSLGGSFPQGGAPLAALPEARRVPIFLACGQHSSGYPAEQTCDDLRLLHSAGMAVDLRLYPCGQEITEHMLADMNRWMMALVTGQSTAPGSQRPTQA